MAEILIAPPDKSQADAQLGSPSAAVRTSHAARSTGLQHAHEGRLQPISTTGSASLAARLAAPFRSTDELLQLLVPPLAHLGLLPDHPQLCNDYGPAAATNEPFDTKRFLRRQIGLVQKALVERTWPDWQQAVVAQHGPAGVAVFERYFVPPTGAQGALPVNAAEVAISAVGVLSSFLAVKTASQLHPRALQLALDLLAKLLSRFSLEQLYFATIGRPSSSSKQGGPRGEAGPEEADPLEMAKWEATLRDILAVPFRAANAAGAASADGPLRVSNALRNLPPALDPRPYRSALAHSFASLLWRLAGSSASVPASPTALAQPLSSLVSDPSFVPTLVPILIPRFLPIETFPASSERLLQRQRHMDLWRRTIGELAEREQERFLREWMRVQLLEEDAQESARQRPSGIELPGQRSAAMAFVLETLFGTLDVDNQPLWEIAIAVLLGSSTTALMSLPTSMSALPRAVGIWAASETAKVALLEATMQAWSPAEEIKLGSESRRLYLTSLLLHLVVSLPVRHSAVIALSRSPDFLEAVSSHLSLVAPLTRLLGMLVAEVVSSRTVDPQGNVKPLAFGDEIWAGEDSAKETIRTLRALLLSAEKRDDENNWQDALRSRYSPSTATAGLGPQHQAPSLEREPLKPTSVEEPAPPRPKRPLISIIGEDDDDDDDLEPYDLPPPPSASIKTALDSEDPALYQSAFPSQSAATSGAAGAPSQTRKRGRLRPPVYIAELVSYLKGKDPQGAKEEADGEAERIEMGLKEGELLIRRKAGWGGELSENAVDLAFALMGLQNQFDLEDFDRHKQAMLVALIVACPKEVAPAVIEQYFTDSYSIAQRHSLLAALAFAVRELAGLPIPTVPGDVPQPKPVEPMFPSKQLPPAMHDHLVKRRRNTGPGSEESERVELLATDLTQMALSGARADAETTIPQAAREKALSVNRTTRRSAGLAAAKSAATSRITTATFSTLAAEVFILPLINRFWLYLRDQATSGRHSSGGSYLGSSAVPQLLELILLSRFLATVTVLVHAARHSPAFLAVIVPETLSFVLMLRPIVSSSSSQHVNSAGAPEPARDEDLVVASALELALAALDGTVHLDGGRMLMSSSVANGSGGALVADIKDWAEHVFEAEERKGNGDLAVGRPGRAAAGVLLRVEEIVGKWRLSVGW